MVFLYALVAGTFSFAFSRIVYVLAELAVVLVPVVVNLPDIRGCWLIPGNAVLRKPL